MFTELTSPIYAVADDLPVIIIGVYVDGGTIWFLCVTDDGTLRTAAIDDIVVDVRFRDGDWHDVSPGPSDEEV